MKGEGENGKGEEWWGMGRGKVNKGGEGKKRCVPQLQLLDPPAASTGPHLILWNNTPVGD